MEPRPRGHPRSHMYCLPDAGYQTLVNRSLGLFSQIALLDSSPGFLSFDYSSGLLSWDSSPRAALLGLLFGDSSPWDCFLQVALGDSCPGLFSWNVKIEF